MDYSERLHVPLRWWVQGVMLVASLWLALVVAILEPELLPWAITAVALALMVVMFLSYGALVEVKDGELRAGKAHIDLSYVGEVTALDAERTRRVAGVEADARAHLLLRPYLKEAVRIEITDPSDPTPYWLVHSRHAEALAEALRRATAAQRHRDTPAL